MARRYWIGTSGWVYRHWQGRFYPPALPQAEWFDYYSRHFQTVEINASFYRLPSERTWRSWAERAPHHFCFAVKASRFITHIKQLQDCAGPVELFLRRAVLLGEHCGPILYQLPPSFIRDDARLSAFLDLLPPSFRHVVEFRHRSWFDDAVFARLREKNVAFCIFHMSGLETPRVVTADFTYIRLHGAESLYSGRYGERQLIDWAEWLLHLHPAVAEAFVYFNNDAHAYAVENALTLRHLLRVVE